MTKQEQLDDQLLSRFIERFLGYGDLEAKFWFIGMEEGGGRSLDDVQRRLSTWRDFDEPEVVDLWDFHQRIGALRHFGNQPKLQKTWAQIARLVLAAKGESTESQGIRKYQANELGRRGGETCLLELMPLPSPGVSLWNYDEWSSLELLRSRETYTQELAAKRADKLKTLIAARSPAAVVFYGLRYLEYWKQVASMELKDDGSGLRIGHRGRTSFLALRHPVSRGRVADLYECAGRHLQEAGPDVLAKLCQI